LGAGGLLALPIDHEGVEVIAMAFPTLPTGGVQRGADHIDLVLAWRTHEQVRHDIAAVEHVRARRASGIRTAKLLRARMVPSCIAGA